MLNVFIVFVIGFLIFTQSGLGAYKYIYLNEFVDEEKLVTTVKTILLNLVVEIGIQTTGDSQVKS